jgi:L-threonine-O-3-phosphate decarboxylase
LARASGRPARELLDFSANINPLGMPKAARDALLGGIDALGSYPDPSCSALRQAIGAHLDVDPAHLVAGNGAEQLIWWLPRLLLPRRVLVTAPCYVDYQRAAAVWGVPVDTLTLSLDDGFRLDLERLAAALRPGDLVWIGQPNNPTGILVDPEPLQQLARSRPDVDWAVDEAFIDFVDAAPTAARWRLPNLIVLRSMTKFYALAGLRLGYAVLSPERAKQLMQLLPDWSVNSLAAAAGAAVLSDPHQEHFAEQTRALVREQREQLRFALRAQGVRALEAVANYLLLRLPVAGPTAKVVAERLLLRFGIAVRVCDNYRGLDERYFRIAVRGVDENRRLVQALQEVLAGSG